MLRILFAGLFGIILIVPAGKAQSGPQAGGHELQVWTSGGHGLNGSTAPTSVWSFGARYGWVLTNPAGPGFLRGRFEYAVDVVPVFLVDQRTGAVTSVLNTYPSGETTEQTVHTRAATYGFGVNPFALKWDFVPHHGVVPYLDLEGGTLFSNAQVPPGTSRVNFTSSGGIGLHFLRSKFNWTAELRFVHISSAGLASPNPGINTLQLRIGFGRFTQPK